MPRKLSDGGVQYPDGLVTLNGWSFATQATVNPIAADLAAVSATAGRFCIYMKNQKLVIAYNLAGTVNYLRIALDGSATSWGHNSTPP